MCQGVGPVSGEVGVVADGDGDRGGGGEGGRGGEMGDSVLGDYADTIEEEGEVEDERGEVERGWGEGGGGGGGGALSLQRGQTIEGLRY
jgi:hypothetical protein